MEQIDFGLKMKGFCGVGLKGNMEDFSSEELHVHPFHQVLQIKNGVSLLQDAKITKPQFGHLMAFIPANTPHRTKVLGDAVEYQSLYFNSAFLPKKKKVITVFKMSNLGLALLDQLNSVASLKNLSSGLNKQCLTLFVKILSSDLRNEVDLLSLCRPQVELNRRLCAYIEEHYHGKITAEDLTSHFPLSFRQISRIFKADMKVSFFEYLRLFRMLKASILLKTSDEKIVNIALDCGYDSTSSFFTDFKKVFGLSPREFRLLAI